MSAGKVVLGAMSGMAIGAILGVLFAPDKGANTRKQLSRKGSDYVDTLKERGDQYVDALGEGLDSVKQKAIGLGDSVKGAVDSLAGAEAPRTTRRI